MEVAKPIPKNILNLIFVNEKRWQQELFSGVNRLEFGLNYLIRGTSGIK